MHKQHSCIEELMLLPVLSELLVFCRLSLGAETSTRSTGMQHSRGEQQQQQPEQPVLVSSWADVVSVHLTIQFALSLQFCS